MSAASRPNLKEITPSLVVLLLGLGFMLSILLRLIIGGTGAARSPWAGLVFACCLFLMAYVLRTKILFSQRSLIIGIAGAAVLLFPPLVFRILSGQSHTPQGNYLSWALVVSIVAFAEEYFLRGALYDAIKRWKGDWLAVFACAIAFAVLHIPLYGLGVIPLDFAVGVWLGLVRYLSGSAFSSGITHVLADLVGWWLR